MKGIVTKASNLQAEHLVWKPIHANNIKSNPIEGIYCLILNTDETGRIYGRKYTIIFQKETDEKGMVVGDIDQYILFEKSYTDILGPTDYPEPTDNPSHMDNNCFTLCAYDINDYGKFVHAYSDIEKAKTRAVYQFKAVFAYAMSHIITE